MSSTTLVFALVVFLGIVVESTAGFGATVVTVTLASHLLPIEDVLAAFVPVNMLMSAYFVLRYRALIDKKMLVRRVLPFMGPGMVVGMALFQLRGAGWIKIAFGAFVVVLAIVELVGAFLEKAGEERKSLPKPAAVGALFGAGVIHGLFACGGPLLVYVTSREIQDKGRFRATLSAVWLTLNIVLASSYVVEGTINRSSLQTSGVLLGAFLIGLPVGEKVHGKLAPEKFRVAVFGLLLFAGGALLLRSLLG